MGAVADDPDELELVRKAILISKECPECCRWENRSAVRLTAAGFQIRNFEILDLLYNYTRFQRDGIKQVLEHRNFNRKYYYKAIIPVSQFSKGLFVEIVLMDRDPEFPELEVVNAHEQR